MLTARTDDALIPVYVINLKDSVSRREHMKREMTKAEIPFAFIDAIRGEEIAQTRGTVTRNQTACALSHLHVIRMIAEGEHDYGAVFEDDIVISPDAKPFLDSRTLRAFPRFDIMQLCSLTNRPRLAMTIATLPSGHHICAGPSPSPGTQALIYHKPAAQRIVREITEISAAIDMMLFHRMDVFGLRIVSVRPAVVEHANFHSTIAAEGPKITNKIRNKIGRELDRGMKCMSRIVSFSAAWALSRQM